MHTHQYQISGITCNNCVTKIKDTLLQAAGVKTVEISKETGIAQIEMNRHFPLSELQRIISTAGNYTITKNDLPATEITTEANTSLWQTYKPVFILGIYITTLAILLGCQNSSFSITTAMRVFMSGFFLSFSFFKLLNLPAFADGYSTYDLIAMRFRPWAYIYAFIELTLGIAYAMNFNPFATNLFTFIIMSVSLAGVLQTVLNKRKIQCACLGAVFNLPVSSITIIEDTLMVVMSGLMLFMLKIG